MAFLDERQGTQTSSTLGGLGREKETPEDSEFNSKGRNQH